MKNTMKTISIALTVASASAWLGATHADAAILFDNTSNLSQAIGEPGSGTRLSDGAAGITFTVGSSGLTLSSAVFGLYDTNGASGSVGLRLYAGATATGTVLQQINASSFAINSLASGGSKITFDTSAWTDLAANTQYTLAVFWFAGNPRMGDSGLASSSWASSGLTFNHFVYRNSSVAPENFYVQLNGAAPVAIPGAGLASLATIGVAGLARRRRR